MSTISRTDEAERNRYVSAARRRPSAQCCAINRILAFDAHVASKAQQKAQNGLNSVVLPTPLELTQRRPAARARTTRRRARDRRAVTAGQIMADFEGSGARTSTRSDTAGAVSPGAHSDFLCRQIRYTNNGAAWDGREDGQQYYLGGSWQMLRRVITRHEGTRRR